MRRLWWNRSILPWLSDLIGYDLNDGRRWHLFGRQYLDVQVYGAPREGFSVGSAYQPDVGQPARALGSAGQSTPSLK